MREFPTNIFVPENVKPVKVIRVVSSIFGVSKAAMQTKGLRSCVDARHVACVLLRKLGCSLQETADFFNVNTSSVCNAQKVVPNKYEGDKLFASKFDMALTELEGKGFNMSIEEARKLIEKTDYWTAVANGTGSEIAKVDAVAFFMEGYNHALNKLKLV